MGDNLGIQRALSNASFYGLQSLNAGLCRISKQFQENFNLLQHINTRGLLGNNF